MLELKNINMRAGDLHIKDASFIIPQGVCHALLGATGNGKTVLLETIAGIRKAESGNICVYNENVTDLPSNKRHIGYVPQDLSLFPHLSVKENIYFSWRFKKNISEKYQYEMEDILKVLKIDKLLDRRIINLSGGEKQRVALARALANEHKILLLDEPFTALHQMMKMEIWDMIKELKKKFNLTILLVTHDLDEAHFLADTISIIHEGNILETGTKDQVFSHPKNKITAQLLDYYVFLNCKVLKPCAVDKYISYCNEIGRDLIIKNKKINIGKHTEVAIKSKDIEVYLPETALDEENTFKAIVKDIYELKGLTHLIASPIDNPEYKIRIVKYKLEIKLNDEILIKLNPDMMFEI